MGEGASLNKKKALVVLLLVLAACGDNMFSGNLQPVPPVHRIPPDVTGAIVLVGEDAVIETNDPEHVARANERRVPQDYRAAMVEALVLAGFKVVADRAQPHDLVAKLALRVSEHGDEVRQVYRCGLRAPDGSEVAQIDWAWPKGTYVATGDVYSYATHNLATEIATSRRVLEHLQTSRARPNK
jgi:hypothetical protein